MTALNLSELSQCFPFNSQWNSQHQLRKRGLWWMCEWGCVQPSVPKLLYSVYFVVFKSVLCSLVASLTRIRSTHCLLWNKHLSCSPLVLHGLSPLEICWQIGSSDWLQLFSIRYFICFRVMYTVMIYVVSCSWRLIEIWYALWLCVKIVDILIVWLRLGLRYTCMNGQILRD